MMLPRLAVAAALLVAVAAGGSVPTEKDAAGFARWLVQSLPYGTMGTVDRRSGFPFASEEDCAQDGAHTGGLRFVLPSLSQSHQNLVADPRGSYSLARTNCSCEVNCAGMPFDVLVCERATFSGNFTMLNVSMEWPTDNPDLLQFAAEHPAFADYLKAGTPHQWFLWQLNIERIDYTGGYGGWGAAVADGPATNISGHYIGPISLGLYFAATPTTPP